MIRIFTTISKIFIIFFVLFTANIALAQDECAYPVYQDEGYTVSISSVTENGDGTHTIVMIVENDGCAGCKKLNRFSVEADPGTYSGISVEVLSGNFTFANIDYGPNLGGDPFQGFRINNTNGMGNGQAAAFALTYTLSGGLQDQQMLTKAGSNGMVSSFSAGDFQSVYNCLNQNIFPYYNPLENGKSYDLIGSELTSLYYTYVQTGSYISDDIFQILDTAVLIEVHTQPGQYAAALSLLTGAGYGLTVTAENTAEGIITGFLPIVNLISLNDLPDLINFARPVYSALSNAGLVTSQGDTAMRAYFARNGFNLSGAGIKIGVLSDSYNTLLGNPAADDIIRGDLPGPANPDNTVPVDVVLDYPYGTLSDEGRAMLQIVHDVAPGAELAFRTGFLGAADFAQGIYELQQAGCDIIVDDITYINEPFFRDGIVAQAVNDVRSMGVAYFSAAGNFGSKSYQSAFYPVAAPTGVVGEAHNFAGAMGGNDIFQSISLDEGNYTVVFQWDDGTPGNTTSSDYDIYLTQDDGTTLFGFNRNNTGGAPIEVLPFTVEGDNATTNFMIIRESGSGSAILKYIIFRGTISINEYATNSSTLVGQANAEGAMAVGAVLWDRTPSYGAPLDSLTAASFSSRGGTPVNGIVRPKPDLMAPNGVNTTVDLGGVNYDGDEFPNFFGTSAAAPHAAAVAALVLEARSKFYDDNLTPGQLKGTLQNASIDMHTPGLDLISGSGFILADAALLTMANPSPYITGIAYDTTLVPGQDTINLIVYGQYLTNGSQVWFNGSPVDTGSFLQGDTAIITVIPPFNELYPQIQVYNPPMEGTNGSDGGLSNPLYFFTKETILVTIDDATKKYGEMMPAFTASYSVESVDTSLTLEAAGLTQQEIDRIHNIGLATIATNLSNVGLWGIEADPNDPLNPESGVPATDSLDISLLQNYNFVFERGLLGIEKLDLVIIPNDTSFVYNDSMGGFTFEYVFNNDTLNNIMIDVADSLAILSALQAAHGTALVNATALVRGTALVNELGESLLDATALVNTGMMITQAMLQSRGTALVNGDLLDAEALLNAAADASSSTLVRGTALVNALEMVRGTALVNELDTTGAIVNTLTLSKGTALVNANAQVNTTTINANSNEEVIVILGEQDIDILTGDSTGNVVIRSINMVTGNEVGQHLIVPGALLSNNFNISYGLGQLTIEPDTAEIFFDPATLAQSYDGTPKTVTVTTIPDSLSVLITYDNMSEGPVNTGSYTVDVTVIDSNYVGWATATLVIDPAQAIVRVDPAIYYISKGLPLPAFAVAYEGFLNGDDESVVTSQGTTLSPNYNGNAGVYSIIPNATADNYVFTPVNGTLYVNPSGPGTKQVKPIFLCYEQLSAPDSNGFLFLAHFEYENKNSTAIYIPIGPDNEITGGAHNNFQQPEVFYPGGGSLVVPYDGNQITWQVTSNKNNGSKGAIPANSSNTQCNKSDEAEAPALALDEEAEGIKLYPNPSTGKVFIQLNGHLVQSGDVQVYDIFGKRMDIHPVSSSDQQLEIDLSSLKSGLYLVKVVHEAEMEVFRVVKK